jgi:GNAT superfamily N-acetyltransferase
MHTIVQAATDEHRQHTRALFYEYLTWANALLGQEFDIHFAIDEMIEQDMRELYKFSPPDGRLLLALNGADAQGCACMRRIGPQMAELKRMYVRPAWRRSGVGRALLAASIAEARAAEYMTLRLDSTRFMHAAHALYQSAGFRPIAPYPESEIPAQYHAHWVFMERGLTD